MSHEVFPSTAEEIIVEKLTRDQWDVISRATDEFDPEVYGMVLAQTQLMDLDIPEGQSRIVSVEVGNEIKKIQVTNVDGTYDFNTEIERA